MRGHVWLGVKKVGVERVGVTKNLEEKFCQLLGLFLPCLGNGSAPERKKYEVLNLRPNPQGEDSPLIVMSNLLPRSEEGGKEKRPH